MSKSYYVLVIILVLGLLLPACADDPVLFKEGPVEMTVTEIGCSSRVLTFTTQILNTSNEPVTKGAVYVVARITGSNEGGLDVYPITKPLEPNVPIIQTFRIELHCNEDYTYEFKYKNEFQLEKIKREME